MTNNQLEELIQLKKTEIANAILKKNAGACRFKIRELKQLCNKRSK